MQSHVRCVPLYVYTKTIKISFITYPENMLSNDKLLIYMCECISVFQLFIGTTAGSLFSREEKQNRFDSLKWK